MLRIRHLFININTDKGVFGIRQSGYALDSRDPNI